MAAKDRVFQHERQPLLPLNHAYRLSNQRGDERETHNALQLSLLPDPQPCQQPQEFRPDLHHHQQKLLLW